MCTECILDLLHNYLIILIYDFVFLVIRPKMTNFGSKLNVVIYV